MSAARRLDAKVLVIGSGPGGAMTAHVLAQGGHDVLVVEEGEPSFAAWASCLPLGVLQRCIDRSRRSRAA